MINILVLHEQKRQILVQVEKLRINLEDEGKFTEEQIEDKCNKAEQILLDKLEEGRLDL